MFSLFKEIILFIKVRKKYWLVPLIIVLIVFGAGKLPKVAAELAKGIKSFKQGLKENKKKDEEKN